MLIKIVLIHCKFQIKLFCKISYNSSSCPRLSNIYCLPQILNMKICHNIHHKNNYVHSILTVLYT